MIEINKESSARRTVSFSPPDITEAEIEEVATALRSGWITTGPRTKDLEKRLAAADIHMVSLRTDWNGIVVPSKFFGSLAVGRPILFSGSDCNSLATYCQTYKIGYILSDETPDLLHGLLSNELLLQQLKENALDVYQKHFSKDIICQKWNCLLKEIEERKQKTT